MAYYVDLFSPGTYEAFSRSDRGVSGFRPRQENAASAVHVGDKLVCYMTKLSRWIGVLEVTSKWFRDSTPIFYPEDDPFIVRFRVKPIVWLEKDKAIPIREVGVWEHLSFTKGYDKGSSTWTGKLRASLTPLDKSDGRFLETLIIEQASLGKPYPIEEKEYQKYLTHKVRRIDKHVDVTVPDDTEPEQPSLPKAPDEVRELIRIQALLASIGAQMGMSIWIPRNNRAAVIAEWHDGHPPLVDILPLNYDDATLRTIEQIDLLWLKGRMIVRAFEVEHTTSIYSGLLRMADLLALQPNMDIKLHIVAPESRREKVFQELRRPVFSLLEPRPLSERCTYLSYGSVEELSQLEHLGHTAHTVLDDYSEEPE